MTKNYKYSLPVFLSVALLLLATDADAQRRYYPRNRGRVVVYQQRSPVMMRHYAPRVYVNTMPFMSINFGGMAYRYQRGYYYRPMGSSFQMVIPPFGLRINTLPIGYSTVMVGAMPYYYYNNVYYKKHDTDYEVVAPPLGAVVKTLPAGTSVKVINGQKYHEQNGTYYAEFFDDKGALKYEVVGTDGVLNTDDTEETDTDLLETQGPKVGDRFTDLPADCKTVVIKGEKLYLTPDGKYYKEVVDGDKVMYELVGE